MSKVDNKLQVLGENTEVPVQSDELLSILELADRFNISERTVRRIIKEHNIQHVSTRPTSAGGAAEKLYSYAGMVPLYQKPTTCVKFDTGGTAFDAVVPCSTDIGTVSNESYEDCLTVLELADRFNISERTVRRMIEKYNIESVLMPPWLENDDKTYRYRYTDFCTYNLTEEQKEQLHVGATITKESETPEGRAKLEAMFAIARQVSGDITMLQLEQKLSADDFTAKVLRCYESLQIHFESQSRHINALRDEFDEECARLRNDKEWFKKETDNANACITDMLNRHDRQGRKHAMRYHMLTLKYKDLRTKYSKAKKRLRKFKDFYMEHKLKEGT